MAIEVKDTRTIILTDEDRFTITAKRGLGDPVQMKVDTMTFTRRSTERADLRRSVRLAGEDPKTKKRVSGYVFIGKLPYAMGALLRDDIPEV